jgi:hypothetical protein
MDDPGVIANRLTDAATDIVNEAKNIAVGTNLADYTAANMVETYTKSIDLALSGAQRMFTALVKQEQVEDDSAAKGRQLVADAVATIARRMVRQTGAVAKETSELMDKAPYSPSSWTKSMVKLADIALLGSIEMAETALLGPAPFETGLVMSDDITAPGSGRRLLRIATPGLSRPGTSDAIPAGKLSYYTKKAADVVELPGAVLPSGKHTLRVAVDPRGLISGIYVGQIEAVEVDGAGVVQKAPDGSDKLVGKPVSFEIGL